MLKKIVIKKIKERIKLLVLIFLVFFSSWFLEIWKYVPINVIIILLFFAQFFDIYSTYQGFKVSHEFFYKAETNQLLNILVKKFGYFIASFIICLIEISTIFMISYLLTILFMDDIKIWMFFSIFAFTFSIGHFYASINNTIIVSKIKYKSQML